MWCWRLQWVGLIVAVAAGLLLALLLPVAAVIALLCGICAALYLWNCRK